ncbi:hypothetical protein DV701_05250 [Ornithinimicrobium avium]|uniref:Uncharacterized protein n=1 Tax=Ornithinimicrobium avium TaxID=2283195 RepID=A0A345NKP5_9MICO|nr:hypothetical protein DV701_05250 [Ornithinimicrobium avium]
MSTTFVQVVASYQLYQTLPTKSEDDPSPKKAYHIVVDVPAGTSTFEVLLAIGEMPGQSEVATPETQCDPFSPNPKKP